MRACLFVAAAGALLVTDSTAIASDIVLSKRVIADEADFDKSEKRALPLLQRLNSALVYIDWMIVSDGTPETCERVLGEAQKAGSLQFNPYSYHHALIEIVIPKNETFPLFEMNCQYRVEPIVGYDFRIRGLFYVLKTDIPTAQSFQLRSVHTTTDDISKLVRAGAF